jgi:intracellular multiplication protein IcmB
MSFMDPMIESVDSLLMWLSSSLKQTTEAYVEIETADDDYTLVSRDGSLVSILRVEGVTALMGATEFDRLQEVISSNLQAIMKQVGNSIQVFFSYDPVLVRDDIMENYAPSRETAKRVNLDLDDLFSERVNFLSRYCAQERVYIVLWTRPLILSKEQFQRALKDKKKSFADSKVPAFKNTQNLIAVLPDLRDNHSTLVRSVLDELNSANVSTQLLDIHDAVRAMRESVDPEFTDQKWLPTLPGDKIPARSPKPGQKPDDLSNLLWPPIYQQIFPRDAENLDLRTTRIGDRIYSSVFIDLFPKEIWPFSNLFNKALSAQIPWRISFLIEGGGRGALRFKALLAKILSFSSAQNRLISNAADLISYLDINTDDSIVKLSVAAATWAPADDMRKLRVNAALLAKAIQGWGSNDVAEVCGDSLDGVVSSALALSSKSVATASIAPLSDVIYMLPLTRPASPWAHGSLLFRSPDGKPWPFQPGSAQQTTWIDLLYARPGSGKSVLSNAINLGLCLAGGIPRLPYISIIDIGPSSSGLISLLKEALPVEKRHWVAYHRLQMTPEYSINPFDTQLGCRYPTPLERSFLVNFLTLLATPLGQDRSYDGIADLAGMVVDELYKNLADDGNPTRYTSDMEPLIDNILEEIGFVRDPQTTWWEVTDTLFLSGFHYEAYHAQRYAAPLIADAASIVRNPAFMDLYGKITTPTGEPLISAFSRMISSAVREYPILSRITRFDIGEAKIVSLDLDEVAKSGGEAADRQTAVMYMLARYVLGRGFYFTEASLAYIQEQYRNYHRARISEIREDHKRLVYDEFHRTSKAQAVRDQVIIDMREGRKWKVQICLISQSVDDFDPVMVEFATAIYIMDAGPAQAIAKTATIFGLSETAQIALRTRVHGPREGGATFLVQYATKTGINMQLLTCTLGPIELWAFSTTAEDVKIRNALYHELGPKEGRRLLATLFPSGSATKLIEQRLLKIREERGQITDTVEKSIVEELINQILDQYAQNPDLKRIT